MCGCPYSDALNCARAKINPGELYGPCGCACHKPSPDAQSGASVMGRVGQRTESSQSFDVRIEDERGFLCSVQIDPLRGPRGFSGRLIAERGTGERVPIENVLRFLDELWTIAYTEGMKRQRDGA